MRSFRHWFLPLAALLVVSPLLARADDFNLGVQDAPPGPGEYSNSFTFSFGACPVDLNGQSEGDGCFTGENLSGDTWTSLDFTIDDTPALQQAGQTAGCTPSGGFFGACSSSGVADNGEFTVLFFGGTGIADFQYFTIIENGAPYGDFDPINVVANTPEPSSLLLLGTGFLAISFLCYKGMRRAEG